MRRTIVIASLPLIIAPPLALAQGTPTPPFKFDRTSEDWSMMKDEANHTRPWHTLKWIDFGDTGHITFGGELKVRQEWIDAPNFGATGLGDDAYVLQRTLLHADVHFNSNIRTFIQVSQHEATGRDTFFPLDDGGADIQQAFADFRIGDSKSNLTLRAGRQELALSPRLGATREGANVRANYDGVRVLATHGKWRADAWALHPVNVGEDDFDDEADEAYDFGGVRASYGFGEKQAWRLTGQVQFTHRDAQRIRATVAEDDRQTFGLRLMGAQSNFDFDAEHHFQTGNFGAQNVDAFFGGGDAGYTFSDVALKPRLGARWLYGSGDRSATDNEMNTFTGNVARPPCCSDPFWIAPANARTLAPVVTITPHKSLTLEAKYDFIDRLETADAIYSVPLQAYPGTAGRLGTDRLSTGPSFVAAWSPVPEVTVLLSHTENSADGVLKASGGKDARFSWASLTLRF